MFPNLRLAFMRLMIQDFLVILKLSASELLGNLKELFRQMKYYHHTRVTKEFMCTHCR